MRVIKKKKIKLEPVEEKDDKILGIDRELAKLFVGKGWKGLIDEIYDMLPEGTEVLTVKEKYGTLSIYVDALLPEDWMKLDALEEKSATICEYCGKSGEPKVKRGWIKTACEECHAKR